METASPPASLFSSPPNAVGPVHPIALMRLLLNLNMRSILETHVISRKVHQTLTSAKMNIMPTAVGVLINRSVFLTSNSVLGSPKGCNDLIPAVSTHGDDFSTVPFFGVYDDHRGLICHLILLMNSPDESNFCMNQFDVHLDSFHLLTHLIVFPRLAETIVVLTDYLILSPGLEMRATVAGLISRSVHLSSNSSLSRWVKTYYDLWESNHSAHSLKVMSLFGVYDGCRVPAESKCCINHFEPFPEFHFHLSDAMVFPWTHEFLLYHCTRSIDLMLLESFGDSLCVLSWNAQGLITCVTATGSSKARASSSTDSAHTGNMNRSTLRRSGGTEKDGSKSAGNTSGQGDDDPNNSRRPQEPRSEDSPSLRTIIVSSVEQLNGLDPEFVQLALCPQATIEDMAHIIREGLRRNFQFLQDHLYEQTTLTCILQDTETEEAAAAAAEGKEEEAEDEVLIAAAEAAAAAVMRPAAAEDVDWLVVPGYFSEQEQAFIIAAAAAAAGAGGGGGGGAAAAEEERQDLVAAEAAAAVVGPAAAENDDWLIVSGDFSKQDQTFVIAGAVGEAAAAGGGGGGGGEEVLVVAAEAAAAVMGPAEDDDWLIIPGYFSEEDHAFVIAAAVAAAGVGAGAAAAGGGEEEDDDDDEEEEEDEDYLASDEDVDADNADWWEYTDFNDDLYTESESEPDIKENDPDYSPSGSD